MKLILVRHGETVEGARGLLLGSLPGRLSIKGTKEMARVADRLLALHLQPDGILASDLGRAKESAQILSKKLHRAAVYNPLLRERAGGVVEGKKESEIDWATYEKTPLAQRKHLGGESFTDVKKRVGMFLSGLSTSKKPMVLIVSHNVLIVLLVGLVLGWSIKKSLAYSIKDSIVVLDVKKKRVEKIPLS